MNCQKCSKEMRLIPAGVSKKSGKPYKAFYSCPDRICGGTANTTGNIDAKIVPTISIDDVYQKLCDLETKIDDIRGDLSARP